MTPDERTLIADLFDRLATLESTPRDAEAERAIKEGLKQAPNAVYALVQTALVQDEALKRADARIQELEDALGMNGQQPQRPAGFLDSMRGALFGRQEPPPPRAGSVPSVRAGEAPMGAPDPYRADPYRPGMGGPGMGGPGMGAGMEPPRPGGSFLGTAAAAAAGAIGGSMLLDGIRSMMGGHHPGGATGGGGMSQAAASPWGGSGSSSGGSSDLARDAGLGDIGRSPSGRGGESGGSDRNYGLLNANDSNDTNDELADDNQDFQDQEMDDNDYDDGGSDSSSDE